MLRLGCYVIVREEVQICRVSEASIALAAGGLLENANLAQFPDEIICNRNGSVDDLTHSHDVNDGARIQLLQQDESLAGATTHLRSNSPPVLFAQVHDLARRDGGLLCYNSDSAQEELEPGFPVTRVAHGLQPVVVLCSVLLEVMGQIE